MNSSKNRGWVRLHRRIEDNNLWFLEPFTKAQAWIDLFMNANHKDGIIQIRGNVIPIKRGQIGWSELTMTSRWDWSKNKVRRFLKLLETEQQIEQQKTFMTTIITIKNYDTFQSDDTADDTAEGQQTIQQKDSRRYTNKNEKNVKNEKNSPLEAKKTYKDDKCFMSFYNLYPKKRSPESAWRAWRKISHSEEVDKTISSAVELNKKTDNWKKDGGQFIPYPASWLNARAWEDEISVKINKFQ